MKIVKLPTSRKIEQDPVDLAPDTDSAILEKMNREIMRNDLAYEVGVFRGALWGSLIGSIFWIAVGVALYFLTH